MLSRPKPGESEADLLHFQNQFLAARASPAVKIVKKADKRKGEKGSTDAERPQLQDSKDVVMLDGNFPCGLLLNYCDSLSLSVFLSACLFISLSTQCCFCPACVSSLQYCLFLALSENALVQFYQHPVELPFQHVAFVYIYQLSVVPCQPQCKRHSL